jgi:hypothetical protein
VATFAAKSVSLDGFPPITKLARLAVPKSNPILLLSKFSTTPLLRLPARFCLQKTSKTIKTVSKNGKLGVQHLKLLVVGNKFSTKRNPAPIQYGEFLVEKLSGRFVVHRFDQAQQDTILLQCTASH